MMHGLSSFAHYLKADINFKYVIPKIFCICTSKWETMVVIYGKNRQTLNYSLPVSLVRCKINKAIGPHVLLSKTTIQVFWDLLKEAVQSVQECGEDTEILEGSRYLGSTINNL